MSTSPDSRALRTTGVAPSVMRSIVAIPSAFSSRRIMWPIMADSLESFEDTTTAACNCGDAPSARAAATHNDFRMLATGHLHADCHGVGCRAARQECRRAAQHAPDGVRGSDSGRGPVLNTAVLTPNAGPGPVAVPDR